jgi:hypothetical protein
VNFTKPSTTDLDFSSTARAAKRAKAASMAAAANATSAARDAALTAQNAAGTAQTAAKNAAMTAQHAADAAQVAAKNAAVTAHHAAGTAQTTAHNASDTAQAVASNLSKNVKVRVHTARKWAAPRLESAADYTTSTVAPKVSEALRTTADKVTPAEPESSKRKVLAWSLFGAAVLAGLGAAAALVRARYQAAIAADSEAADEEVMADSTGSQAAPGTSDPTGSAVPRPTDPGSDSSSDGRVKATGR